MPVSINDKLGSILQFLVGVRHPQVRALLAMRGFDDAALEEGWEAFDVASGRRLAYTAPFGQLLAEDDTRKLIELIDGFENDWFPVANATLGRHFPRIRDEVFQNISQTSGPEVIVSVGTFLERIQAMETAPTAETESALALLKQRGLTQALRRETRALVERVRRGSDVTLPEIDAASAAERDKAFEAAWAWYSEWRQIARTVIRRRDILIRLGLAEISSK